MARLVPFSTLLTRWCALVGIPTSRLTTELQEVALAQANTAMSTIWKEGPWLEVCPRGEARFVGNRLSYPNDLTQTASWTATAVTATANSVANPADGQVTASKLMETAANSAHNVAQTVTTFYPSTDYTVSCYVRPNGRSYIRLAASDGVTTYSAFFNVTAGTVGTTANTTSTQIAQQPNGFWLCQLTFTSDAAATSSGSVTLSISSDGSTLSYAGDTAKGVYAWGALVQQTSNVPISDTVLAYEQTGENVIEAVFDVWSQYPYGATSPTRISYELAQDGVQLIGGVTSQTYYVNGSAQSSTFGPAPTNPVFLYYRKDFPVYGGDVFSATETYSVGEKVYFTDAAGDGDYYICLATTTAGEDPEDTPTKWRILPLYEVFFDYVLYQAFGDWLVSDGQNDRAMGIWAIAEQKKLAAFDKLERQQGHQFTFKVSTHQSAMANSWR